VNGDGRPAALLVDADNVTAQCVEFALRELARQGCRVTLRRAYGGHQKLADIKDCLLRHGVRPLVNQGKGTTDALLVVDAMDLLYADRLPAAVAIASSDADFAPLAVRLREAGMQVLCLAHVEKSAGEDLARCYDQLVYVDEAAAPHAPAAPPAVKKRATRPRARANAPVPPAAPPDTTRQLLESFGGFAAGEWLVLGDVVKKLRDAKLLGRSSGVTYLRKHAPYVELQPAEKPNRLRLKTAPA
jgi:hypothetical protein